MLSKNLSQLIRISAIILLSYISVSCGEGEGPKSVVDPTPPTADAYTLVWSDEFNVDGAPNVKNWHIEEGYGNNGWGNNEWQQYTDDAENVRVEGGNLVINAQCSNALTNPALCNNAVRDGTITSARINTKDKFEVKYGKIQARIKVPPGKGTWPAFWMLGSEFPDTPWPAAGEIDIMEIHQFFSNIKTTHFTRHFCDESKQTDQSNCQDFSLPDNNGWTFEEEFKTFDFDLSDDYHVFEAEWNENSLIGKIDGITYYSKSIDPDIQEEFLKSFFMILNVAVGGTLGGPPNSSTSWPQEMMVDWVRVYERNQPDVLELLPDDPSAQWPYVRLLNSAEFGGDSVVATVQRNSYTDLDDPDKDLPNPTQVPPLVGDSILELDYESANTFFSGGAFILKLKDITHYEKLVFSLDTSAFPAFHDISIEMQDNRFTGDGAPGKTSIPLSDATLVSVTGNWKTYEIPLTDFNQTNLDNVALFGFWNPNNAADQLIAGKLYLDDIKFVNEPCTANGVVNFNTDTIFGNSGSTQISVTDTCLANKNKNVVAIVDNGTEAIGVSVPIIASGQGVAFVNFGPTKDATGTIAIREGDVLTVTYTDTAGVNQSDTASIITPPLAVYSESKVDNVLVYSAIINDDTVTDEASTVVSPLEGSVSLQAAYSAVDAENGFAFDVEPLAATALLNASFESPDASGGRVACDFNPPNNGTIITNWECINFPFVYNYTDAVNPGPLPHDGNQTIGAIGLDAIARQSISVTAGDSIKASAYAMNWVGKPLTGIAIMQLNFFDAAANQINSFEVLGSADGSQTYTLAPKAGNNVSDWTLMEISAVAPAGAATAQIFLLHVIGGGTAESAVFWDDASLAPVSPGAQPNDISYFSTLKFGLNSSVAAGLMDVEIRMTDGSAGSASVFLSNLTPAAGAVAGWNEYEIPLSVFTGLDLTDISTLGFYNASTDTVGGSSYPTLFNTTLYFDDVHFALDDPAVQTGMLINSAIEGVAFSTDTQSGVTNAAGEFQYLQGELITFSVGDIVLGAIVGAPVITPVELTGSANPTNQAATNMLVFLQSIDADQIQSNGITISAATQAAAVGQTLDFTLDSAAFTTTVTAVVNAIAPGNTVVSEAVAVNNFYQTFPPTVSAATTTITAAPGTVDADGTETSTITVQAKDSSGNNITVSAGAVTLSSTPNVVISPVVDNLDGTYTATVTNATAEIVTITGTIAGNTITDNVSVTFVGAVSGATTAIEASSPIEADGIAKSTITVRAKDANGNNFVKSAGVVDLTLTEVNPDNSASFENGTQSTTATDNGDGTYTAYVKNSEAEDVTITGNIATNLIDGNATVSFIVGAASGTTTTISAVASAAVDNGSNTGIRSKITVQAKDSGGNNLTVSGGVVNLTIPVSLTATFENGTQTTTATDNTDGTYTAYVKNPVAETITITGTIAGNTITDNATVLFGNTVGVASETNNDAPLIPSDSAFNDAACDQTVALDDAVPSGTGAGEYPAYEGLTSVEVSSLPASPTNGCVDIVVNFGESPGNGIAPYVQDFEAKDINNSFALGVITVPPFNGDGYQVFGDVWDGEVGTGVFKYQYGPNTAPNSTAVVTTAFSGIATGEGGPEQGLQYLSVFSDYENADHANTGACAGDPNPPTTCTINTSVFQEPRSERTGFELIQPGDIGSVLTFSGDFKAPSSGGIAEPTSNATASVYIKTLDPNSGYATTNNIQFDSTTADPNNWGSFSIEIRLTDPALAGQILQFGFGTVATNYESSGVFYDNLSFTGRTVDVTGYATLKFAGDISGVTGDPFADMELKMDDASGGTASVYLSDYMPLPANPAIAGADWQLYEIPLADFTGTLDKTMMKSLTFKDPSSTVIPAPGVTPLTGTIRIDDIHFITQP